MFMKVPTLHQGMDHHRLNHKDIHPQGCHSHQGSTTEATLLHLLDPIVIRATLMINTLLHHHLSTCTTMVAVAIMVMTMDVLHS